MAEYGALPASNTLPIFIKVEGTLNTDWVRSFGTDVTTLLTRIEKTLGPDVRITFRGGCHIISGSLSTLNRVHECLSSSENSSRHLQLHLDVDEAIGRWLSGAPSEKWAPPVESRRRSGERHCPTSDIREGEATDMERSEFVTCNQSVAVSDRQLWQKDCSEENEDRAKRTSSGQANIEGNSVESRGREKDEDGDGLSDEDAGETNKTDHRNKTVADAGVFAAVSSNQVHDSGIEFPKEPVGCTSLPEGMPTKDCVVDPDVWEYMKNRKCDELRETLASLGASYECQWDADSALYKIRLLVDDSSALPSESLQDKVALAWEKFNQLYQQSFESCEIESVSGSFADGDLPVEHMNTKFPSVLLKVNDGGLLLIGPHDGVCKAKKHLTKILKEKRMHKSRLTQSMYAERGTSSLLPETNRTKACTMGGDSGMTDEGAKHEGTSLPTEIGVSAEVEEEPGVGEGSITRNLTLEHLSSDVQTCKSSSSESFAVLQASRDSSLDEIDRDA